MTNKSAIFCAICGCEGARNNYRVMTCEKCRVFFFRMITHKPPIPMCNKNCRYKSGARKNCITCRFKRCIEAGMQPVEVGKWSNKTQYCVDVINKDEYKIYHSVLINFGLRAAPHLQLNPAAVNFTRILANFEKLSISGSGPTINDSSANLNISVSELIQNPGACSSRETAVFYPVWIDPFIQSVDFNKCYCRSLTAFSEFIAALEEFHFLDDEDKIRMFQINSLKYIMLEILYRNFLVKKNNYFAYSILPYNGKNAPPNHWNRRRDMFKNNSIMAIQELTELDISFEEYLLLRIISTFSNSTNMSNRGQEILIQAKEKYTLILAQFVGTFLPQNLVIERVSRIVNIVKFIEDLANFAKESYIRMVLNNHEEMAGRLSHELHVKGTIYDSGSCPL